MKEGHIVHWRFKIVYFDKNKPIADNNKNLIGDLRQLIDKPNLDLIVSKFKIKLKLNASYKKAVKYHKYTT